MLRHFLNSDSIEVEENCEHRMRSGDGNKVKTGIQIEPFLAFLNRNWVTAIMAMISSVLFSSLI